MDPPVLNSPRLGTSGSDNPSADPSSRGAGELEEAEEIGGGLPEAGGPDDILIEELDLGVRSYNCLKRGGIQTVGQLLERSEAELAAIPNFGRKSIQEVVDVLADRGLALKG